MFELEEEVCGCAVIDSRYLNFFRRTNLPMVRRDGCQLTLRFGSPNRRTKLLTNPRVLADCFDFGTSFGKRRRYALAAQACVTLAGCPTLVAPAFWSDRVGTTTTKAPLYCVHQSQPQTAKSRVKS